jgi:endo-1,4-beta-xylanase
VLDYFTMRVHSTLSTALIAVPAVSAQLNTLAKAAGKLYFGTATDNGELSGNETNVEYVSILSNTSEFGQITPGNTQKVSAFVSTRVLIY